MGKLTVRPGESIMGGQDFIHELHDEQGQRVGHVWVTPRADSLHINHIGAAGHTPNATGLSNVRDVIGQLKGFYPDAKRLTGGRVSGRRIGKQVDAKLARLEEDRHDGLVTTLHATPEDQTARGAFADLLEENGVPGAHVVRHHAALNAQDATWSHNPSTRIHSLIGIAVGTGPLVMLSPEAESPRLGEIKDFHGAFLAGHDFPAAQVFHPRGMGANKGGLVVAVRHTARDRTAVGHVAHVHTPEELLAVTADFPPAARRQLLQPLIDRGVLRRALRGKGSRSLKLARINGPSSAVAQGGSTNHETRLGVARAVLKEAGLPALVRAVMTRDSNQGVRAAVSAVLKDANPKLARYAAAWMGLLTGERKMTVFHPGDGQDILHVIDSPHPPEHVGDYLSKAGVPQFSMEKAGRGTRAYVVSPMDLIDVKTAANGLGGSHQSLRGTAHRLGSSEDSDASARAAFRQVIDDTQREAGL